MENCNGLKIDNGELQKTKNEFGMKSYSHFQFSIINSQFPNYGIATATPSSACASGYRMLLLISTLNE
jgi:hypothetical protein